MERSLDHFWARSLDTPYKADGHRSTTVLIQIHLLAVASSYLGISILPNSYTTLENVLSLQIIDGANKTPHFSWMLIIHSSSSRCCNKCSSEWMNDMVETCLGWHEDRKTWKCLLHVSSSFSLIRTFLMDTT